MKCFSEDETLRVNLTTLVGDGEEELITSSLPTAYFTAEISVQDYDFRRDPNRWLRIYIYDFKTPLIIFVSVTHQYPMNRLTLFLVIFAFIISLLLIAGIVWKVMKQNIIFIDN